VSRLAAARGRGFCRLRADGCQHKLKSGFHKESRVASIECGAGVGLGARSDRAVTVGNR
jgi:hypothetical protein